MNVPKMADTTTINAVAAGIPEPVLAMTCESFPHNAQVAGASRLDQRLAPQWIPGPLQ